MTSGNQGHLVRALGGRLADRPLAGPAARRVSHAVAAAPRWSPWRALAPVRSKVKGQVTANRLVQVVDALDRTGMTYWLAGGWGVDALCGCQSRRHDDLDVVLDDFDRRVPDARHALVALGFDLVDRHLRPAALLGDQWTLDDGAGCRIDLLSLDEGALAAGILRAGGSPTDLFTDGRVGRRRVPCLTPAAQRVLHSGFASRSVDLHDLRLLPDRKGRPRGGRAAGGHR
ncbi:MAG: nucleotidyltransferase domain-containing protein [Acidimicrobiales bacterium]